LLADDLLFSGFDEVIVFDREPATPTPPPVVFTSDRGLPPEAREALVTYMESHNALAAAGDGVGLCWARRVP
jgi:hypothetical protein